MLVRRLRGSLAADRGSVVTPRPHIGWFGIARLGLVQASLGAIVVVTTTTLNRIMVVELALPAVVPGALVATHYAVQMLRPRWGYGADGSGRRTPWILGGLLVLAAGAVLAALAVAEMPSSRLIGIVMAVPAFLLVGAGVGAAGTSLLTLAATEVAPARRGAAASIIWTMMIAGFAVTGGVAGHFLDPFSMERLVAVMMTVATAALLVSLLALAGLERRAGASALPSSLRVPGSFRRALAQVWAEPPVRRFTLFVFTSMLAYGAQDLILDPFAGAVLGLTPGETTRLSGVQHGGALLGMLAVAFAGAVPRFREAGGLKLCAVGGCFISALALCGLATAGAIGPAWPLRSSVILLGFGNGTFTVAAVGSMMSLAGTGAGQREGVRMGLWGAAQALAFGLGSLIGPALVDVMHHVFASAMPAYALVFLVEASLFLVAARLVSAGATVSSAAGDGATIMAVSA